MSDTPVEEDEELQLEDCAAGRVCAWLRDNLGERALAPLTGTDYAALLAFVQVAELYQRVRIDAAGCKSVEYFEGKQAADQAQIRSNSVLLGLQGCVMQMQDKCQEFAFHAIAMVGNWSDRELWWGEMRLDLPVARTVCKHEPKGGGN